MENQNESKNKDLESQAESSKQAENKQLIVSNFEQIINNNQQQDLTIFTNESETN